MKTRTTILAAALAVATQTATAWAVVFTNNTTLNATNLAYEGQPIIVSNCTLTVNGPHSFASLLLSSNAVLTHSAAPSGEASNRVLLTVTGDVTVDAASRIDVSGKGYTANTGPGAGVGAPYGGSGGGYGGRGGNGSGVVGGSSFGSVTDPNHCGSGGGNGAYGAGAPGGGVVRLSVGGILTVQGQVLANGNTGTGYAAGGAGGTIHLTAGTLAGSGGLVANGGQGSGGGGGGGRIALYYTASTFSGTNSVTGGSGMQVGGAGTIFSKSTVQLVGTLLLDNGGSLGAWTTLTSSVPVNLIVTNGALVHPQAVPLFNHVRVAQGGRLVSPDAQPGFTTTLQGDLTVENGGAILANCEMTVQGNAVIAAGGSVSADGKGYGTDLGPGRGGAAYYGSAGGGYGGPGGNGGNGTVGGTTYGSYTAPVDLGSGGGKDANCGESCPGGPGGGSIRLTVLGQLAVHGTLTADGGAGSAGGGSGGSLYVTAGTLGGAGTISANGGSAGPSDRYGGGGGGRIALHFGTSSFAGQLLALGGQRLTAGAPGTIYRKAFTDTIGILFLHNANRTNAALAYLTNSGPYSLTVTSATVYFPQPVTMARLRVAAGGVLTHPAGGPALDVAVLEDAIIEAGASIPLNGLGYGSGTGSGAGQGGGWGAGGGGYGGRGGDCNAYQAHADGGPTYGSASDPIDLGSGGGPSGWYGAGSAGGGAVRLAVGGTLAMDGVITANGLHGNAAGSGGSIYLTAATLTGSGSLSASGGNASISTPNGGGGGGRIALRANVNAFNGAAWAGWGGGGTNGGANGSAGTVYTNAAPVAVPVALTPSGTITRPLDSFDLVFSISLDPASVSAADFSVQLPSGSSIPTGDLAFSLLDAGRRCRLTFPAQIQAGTYTITVGPSILSLQGAAMTAAFQTNLNVAWPTISGRVQTEGGAPLPGVPVLAMGVTNLLSDTNGGYSFAVTPGWTGTVRPLAANAHFLPEARTYGNLVNHVSGQNFTDYGPCVVPAADYAFENSLASRVPGAPPLSPINSGHYFTNQIVDGVSRTVMRFPALAGLAVNPATLFGPSNSYTMVLFLQFDSVLNWGRILDFKNAATDNGLYVRNGTLQFLGLGTYSATCMTNGTWHQVVITRNATNAVAIYCDGIQRLTANDTTGEAVVASTNLLRFFKDDANGGENFPGRVSRIRIYPCVLSAAAVAALDRGAAEPLSYTLSNPAPDGAGGFRFTVTGPAGLAPTIWRSTNLLNWNLWMNFNPFPGSLIITSAPASGVEFFKARWP